MVDPLTAVPPAVPVLLGAALVATLPRRVGTVAGAGLAALATLQVALVPAGTHLRASLFGFEVVPFAVDPLSRTVGLALAFVSAVAVLYGRGVDTPRRGTALSLAYLGAGLGAVLAGDWLTLLVCWELLAVGATVLVWATGDDDAARAALRYAVYHEVGGVALLAAVAVRYVATGTFLFGDGLGGGIAGAVGLVGIGLNVGFVGLHVWLPDTYPRPDVATSVVLAACTTKVGVYALARAVPDGRLVLAYLGGAMLLVGVTYAVLGTDLRRLLAYHVVSQVGFMVAGVGIGSPLGVAGAAAHLLNNVLYKSLLFAIAGVVIVRAGTGSLKRLGGLARRLPWTFGAFLVAAPAIAGVPGFNGFVSKGMVIDAADAAGLEALWWALIAGSVGTVVSFAKFGYYVFLRAPPADAAAVDGSLPGPRAVRAAMVALAVPCVVLGLLPGVGFAVLPGSTAAAEPFGSSQFVKAGGILGAGAVAFVLLRAPLSRVGTVPDLDAVYHPTGAAATRAVAGGVGVAGTAVAAAADRAAAAGLAVGLGDATDETAPRDAFGRSVLLLAVVFVLFLVAVAL